MKNLVSQNNFTQCIGVVEGQYFFVEKGEGLNPVPIILERTERIN